MQDTVQKQEELIIKGNLQKLHFVALTKCRWWILLSINVWLSKEVHDLVSLSLDFAAGLVLFGWCFWLLPEGVQCNVRENLRLHMLIETPVTKFCFFKELTV